MNGVYGSRFWYSADKGRIFIYDPRSHRFGSFDYPEGFVSPEEALEEYAAQHADDPDLPSPDLRNINRIRYLKLDLSGKCTLNCSYCYRTDLIPEIEDPEVAKRAIDLMVNDFGSEAEQYTVVFNMTSEPFLHWRLLEELLDYSDGITAETGKPFEWFLITNGTVLSESAEPFIRKFYKRNDRLAVSIDGPPEIHDLNRKFPDGTGSHATVMKYIKKYRKLVNRFETWTVLTDDSPPQLELIRYFSAMGFDCITTHRQRGSDAGGPLPDKLKAEYDELFAFIADEIEYDSWEILNKIKGDHALRPMWRLLAGIKVPYRCYVGLTQLVAGGDGNLYLCDYLVGQKDWIVGNIRDGLDRKKFHIDADASKREPCSACWARFICGGTCYAMAINKTGDPASVDPAECSLNRYIAGKNMELLAGLQNKPEQLAKFKKMMFS